MKVVCIVLLSLFVYAPPISAAPPGWDRSPIDMLRGQLGFLRSYLHEGIDVSLPDISALQNQLSPSLHALRQKLEGTSSLSSLDSTITSLRGVKRDGGQSGAKLLREAVQKALDHPLTSPSSSPLSLSQLEKQIVEVVGEDNLVSLLREHGYSVTDGLKDQVEGSMSAVSSLLSNNTLDLHPDFLHNATGLDLSSLERAVLLEKLHKLFEGGDVAGTVGGMLPDLSSPLSSLHGNHTQALLSSAYHTHTNGSVVDVDFGEVVGRLQALLDGGVDLSGFWDKLSVNLMCGTEEDVASSFLASLFDNGATDLTADLKEWTHEQLQALSVEERLSFLTTLTKHIDTIDWGRDELQKLWGTVTGMLGDSQAIGGWPFGGMLHDLVDGSVEDDPAQLVHKFLQRLPLSGRVNFLKNLAAKIDTISWDSADLEELWASLEEFLEGSADTSEPFMSFLEGVLGGGEAHCPSNFMELLLNALDEAKDKHHKTTEEPATTTEAPVTTSVTTEAPVTTVPVTTAGGPTTEATTVLPPTTGPVTTAGGPTNEATTVLPPTTGPVTTAGGPTTEATTVLTPTTGPVTTAGGPTTEATTVLPPTTGPVTTTEAATTVPPTPPPTPSPTLPPTREGVVTTTTISPPVFT